ncbi:MAG: flagellar motor switch protein FliN [Sphingomonadales bacterium]
MSDEQDIPTDDETIADVPAQESAQAAEGVELDDMSTTPAQVEELESQPIEAPDEEDGEQVHTGQELEAVFDVPVNVLAVLGISSLEVNQLLMLAPGAVIELDRKVGEAIDIYVNDRLVARGEVVMVEEHLGVTMTEIIKAPRK